MVKPKSLTSKTVKRTPAKKGAAISVEEFFSLKKPKGDLILDVEGQPVSLTSLERVYWPDEKLTKFDLLCYYLRVSGRLMPFLKNRPAILQRWPRGVNAPMFFQQDLESAPAFIKTVRLTNRDGRELDYAVFTTAASLLHFVNLGTIEQHPWHSIVAKLDRPDWIAIDLDPKQAPWENVLQVALITKQVCDEVGLNAFPKTSGSSGIHIYLPLKPTNEYESIAEFSRMLASEVAQRAPKIATVERTIAKRKKEQVYVDWMQNARGKSLASVFTARAKPKATVSMPLSWKQIEQGVKISDFTIKNVPALLEKNGDAWSNFFDQRQKLKLK
ncbi:MAG TPA: non-homologous end-joining DNA ligase [Pyrinomonadaceae bacterium]|jgi:bifunctional non-homologous end joining protein LigD|nr:non-homologous end-joining DNA ligase [Pyrinomonadaceae bacterium]